jgi:hypothetical protein
MGLRRTAILALSRRCFSLHIDRKHCNFSILTEGMNHMMVDKYLERTNI